MLERLGISLMNFMRRVLPEAFVIAIIITFITLFAGMAAGNSLFDMGVYWGRGVWNLLTFMCQASLTLILGAALVKSRAGYRAISGVARIPQNCAQAAVLVAVVSMVLYYVNWGVGMIGGAILAKEVAVRLYRRGVPVHYPLLGASVYVGILGYEAGFSGGIPLQVATEGHVLAEQMGVIPLTQTIFSPASYVTFLILLIVVPVLLGFMAPKRAENMLLPNEFLSEEEFEEKKEEAAPAQGKKTFAEKMDGARIINFIFFLFTLIYIVDYLKNAGLVGLDLNIVNLILLSLGLLLHESPRSLIAAFQESTESASGILMQFPLYAGIMGMITSSGLVSIIASFFVSISTADTYYVFSFLSAGLLNIFVPSGGGQWSVQGPIMIEAAQTLDLDLAKVAVAVGWGDAWTNLIQPFWVLPIVGLMGGKAKDYLGYTAVLLFISGIIISVSLFVL